MGISSKTRKSSKDCKERDSSKSSKSKKHSKTSQSRRSRSLSPISDASVSDDKKSKRKSKRIKKNKEKSLSPSPKRVKSSVSKRVTSESSNTERKNYYTDPSKEKKSSDYKKSSYESEAQSSSRNSRSNAKYDRERNRDRRRENSRSISRGRDCSENYESRRSSRRKRSRSSEDYTSSKKSHRIEKRSSSRHAEDSKIHKKRYKNDYDESKSSDTRKRVNDNSQDSVEEKKRSKRRVERHSKERISCSPETLDFHKILLNLLDNRKNEDISEDELESLLCPAILTVAQVEIPAEKPVEPETLIEPIAVVNETDESVKEEPEKDIEETQSTGAQNQLDENFASQLQQSADDAEIWDDYWNSKSLLIPQANILTMCSKAANYQKDNMLLLSKPWEAFNNLFSNQNNENKPEDQENTEKQKVPSTLLSEVGVHKMFIKNLNIEMFPDNCVRDNEFSWVQSDFSIPVSKLMQFPLRKQLINTLTP